MQKEFKTIVLSDIHLGSKWSKTKEVNRFLKKHSCETLILCGDIIDGWAILRGQGLKWKRRHTNFIKTLLDLSHDTEIVKYFIYTSFGKRYYVLHGDVFDKVTSSYSWLAKIGDVCYSLLLWINKTYNARRIKKGLPYYSIARQVKHRVKASVSYISDFESHLVQVGKKYNCDGVICGHIHHPEIRMDNDFEYLNSGDWIESLSALVQTHEGEWKLYLYEKQELA